MGNSKSNEKSNQKQNGNIMDNRGTYTQNIPPLNSRSNSPTQSASNQNNGRTTPTLNTNNTGNNSAQSPKTPSEANILMKQALRNSLLSPTESNTTKSNGSVGRNRFNSISSTVTERGSEVVHVSGHSVESPKRPPSTTEFKIGFSEQGDKYKQIQRWLNECIIDDLSPNPILPLPGGSLAVRHRTLPSFPKKGGSPTMSSSGTNLTKQTSPSSAMPSGMFDFTPTQTGRRYSTSNIRS